MTRRLLLLLTVMLAITGLVSACAGDDTGSGYHLSADQLTATTRNTTPDTAAVLPPTAPEAPAPAPTFDIATAKVGRVQVYANRPNTATGAAATDRAPGSAGPVRLVAAEQAYTTSPPQHDPIPRPGLNTAPYVEKTPYGWAYANPTSFGNPLVFAVTARDGDWLKVQISARPNHQEGWVRAADVTVTSTQYRMELNLSNRALTVFDGHNVIAQTNVVIGTDQTQTPVGRFFINEKIKQTNPAGAYGPWILSTNGYSEWLDLFDGGLPVVAFHGTNQPGLIGTKASNGCVRMPNDVVTTLANTLPAGTPIDILP